MMSGSRGWLEDMGLRMPPPSNPLLPSRGRGVTIPRMKENAIASASDVGVVIPTAKGRANESTIVFDRCRD
jgi:hypothetical protein